MNTLSLEPAPKIERTDLFKGEFSPSGLNTASCLRRFYLEKVLRLSYTGNVVPLNFGSALHSAVETFYKLRKQGLPFEQLRMACVQEFAERWSEYGIYGDSKRNLDTGMLTVANYCDTYRYDSSSFDVADIECTQWLPMENGTRILVKIDRVLIGDSLIRLVDTKHTASALTSFFFKKFENDLQTTAYYMVVATLLGRCDDIQIDAICVPPSTPSQPKRECFVRQHFMRTDLQVEDFLNTYKHVTDYIMDSLAKPKEKWPSLFYCNTSECDKYGGCKFLPVCTHGLEHPAVQLDFVIGDVPQVKDSEAPEFIVKQGGKVV